MPSLEPRRVARTLRCAGLAFAVLVLTCRGVLAQEAVESLLRDRGEAFASAMTGPDAAMEAFANAHLAGVATTPGRASAFAGRMREILTELGPIDRHVVQVPTHKRVVFVHCRHTKTGSWQNYQFRVDPADANRLQLVFRAVSIEPLSPPASGLTTATARPWLDRLHAQLEEQQPFSGVALVERDGKDLYSLARGKADVTAGTAVSRSTRFGMASGSKMFTAVAILQLAQAGKLSLHDTLLRHLPDFPDRAFAGKVTLHQLLTHTAGAGNYWDERYERAWNSITDLKGMLPFVVANLDGASAGRFVYSNSGYVLLGLVVEAASGMSYYDYTRARIFEPAGMTATSFPLRGQRGPSDAVAYEPVMEAGAVKRDAFEPAELGARGSSAGGASTTVDDLLRFRKALADGRLLDKAHADLMTRGHVSMGVPDQAYGYGTIIDSSKGVASWGHGGRAPGTHFEFRVYPAQAAALVVMSNYNTIGGPELSSALDGLIRLDPPAR